MYVNFEGISSRLYGCQVTSGYSNQFQNPQGSRVSGFFFFLFVVMCDSPCQAEIINNTYKR